jgi:hypothetical protein
MFDEALSSLNTNLFFIGVMMMVLNIGSRFIVHELSDTDEEYGQNIILRRIAIFAACFVGTRDLTVSLILTASFVVLSTGLFYTKSKYAREGMTNAQLAERGAVVSISSMD